MRENLRAKLLKRKLQKMNVNIRMHSCFFFILECFNAYRSLHQALMCKISIKNQYASRVVALMHMIFGNNPGVHLLEHVC